MRIAKYFTFLFLIVSISLGYAHQQFLLTVANYNIRTYETQLSQLLDHNKKLRYNVTTLEAPANLEARLTADGTDYDVPEKWAVVKRSKSTPSYEFAKVAERRNVVLERILNFVTVKAEAQSIED